MNQLKEINQIAKRYIILKSSRKEVAELVLEWWNSNDD